MRDTPPALLSERTTTLMKNRGGKRMRAFRGVIESGGGREKDIGGLHLTWRHILFAKIMFCLFWTWGNLWGHPKWKPPLPYTSSDSREGCAGWMSPLNVISCFLEILESKDIWVAPREKSIFVCLSSVHPMSCSWMDIVYTEEKRICSCLWRRPDIRQRTNHHAKGCVKITPSINP